MLERVIKEPKVFLLMQKLLYSLNRNTNKDWARLVPAAAVIPAVRVVTTFIRFKAFVAGVTSFL